MSSYYQKQLEKIGLNFVNNEPQNNTGFNVNIQFNLSGSSNWIALSDEQLSAIYKILNTPKS